MGEVSQRMRKRRMEEEKKEDEEWRKAEMNEKGR